jgi:hypothetical protein
VRSKVVYPIASAVVALGVGIYASAVLGRFTPATFFLVGAAVSLTWVVWVSFQAARAITTEPEAGEVARATGRRRKELEREKQALLKALKELEFDHEMGKVSDADYQEIGGNYRARAVRVMRQLDAQSGEVDYKSLVERDLANRRGARPADAKAETRAEAKADAKPAAGDKPPPDKTSEPVSGIRPSCKKCSTANDADAEFCKKCGAKLREEAAS